MNWEIIAFHHSLKEIDRMLVIERVVAGEALYADSRIDLKKKATPANDGKSHFSRCHQKQTLESVYLCSTPYRIVHL